MNNLVQVEIRLDGTDTWIIDTGTVTKIDGNEVAVRITHPGTVSKWLDTDDDPIYFIQTDDPDNYVVNPIGNGPFPRQEDRQ